MKNNGMSRSETMNGRTLSNESDSSDDEIIVKTLSPHKQAVFGDQSPNCSDCEGEQDDSHSSADAMDDTSDDEDGDEVIDKVRRGRMLFPCSSESKAALSSDKGPCLNGCSLHECNRSNQEPKDCKTEEGHKGPDDTKNSSQGESASKVMLPSTEKKTARCSLS